MMPKAGYSQRAAEITSQVIPTHMYAHVTSAACQAKRFSTLSFMISMIDVFRKASATPYGFAKTSEAYQQRTSGGRRDGNLVSRFRSRAAAIQYAYAFHDYYFIFI